MKEKRERDRSLDAAMYQEFKNKRPYNRKQHEAAVEAFNRPKQEEKPAQVTFSAKGNTDGLDRTDVYRLSHASTKSKYEVEKFYRDYMRSKNNGR